MKSFLTAAQRRDLIEYTVANGQNYENYLRWCDKNLIPPDKRYTERSYKAWCDRRRRVIKIVRQEHRVAVRQESIYDRGLRLKKLEEGVTRLDAAIEKLLTGDAYYVDKLVRLEEQKRKLLESIAKERGEWGVRPAEENTAANQLNQAMLHIFAEEKAKVQAQIEEATIEGEFEEVE